MSASLAGVTLLILWKSPIFDVMECIKHLPGRDTRNDSRNTFVLLISQTSFLSDATTTR